MDPLQIESITFSNFKALVNTTLPLGRFTLIVGPNGSGKSTTLQAIECLRRLSANPSEIDKLQTAMASGDDNAMPTLAVNWLGPLSEHQCRLRWIRGQNVSLEMMHRTGNGIAPQSRDNLLSFLKGMRVYSLEASRVAEPVNLTPNAELARDGFGLAVVLDRLRDENPERFEALNEEFGRWLPEYDHILFETPSDGKRAVKFRTRSGGHSILSSELSQGTLLALAILTIAYLPTPPSLIGLEEPDRGIHPRLLRDVRDALYRLAYPESFGESRPPVQVIATTQSPYFLDLFRDHPEEVVIAEKKGLSAEFNPLSSHGHIEEILADASLGDVWYSGILGGVPSQS